MRKGISWAVLKETNRFQHNSFFILALAAYTSNIFPSFLIYLANCVFKKNMKTHAIIPYRYNALWLLIRVYFKKSILKNNFKAKYF